MSRVPRDTSTTRRRRVAAAAGAFARQAAVASADQARTAAGLSNAVATSETLAGARARTDGNAMRAWCCGRSRGCP